MQIKQQSLLDLMGAPDVRFSIPKFQRAYSWDAPQCDELWRDIMRAARAHRSHFMGTLIYLEEQRGGMRELSIVDGQQRLTTVTLILSAFTRYRRETGEQLFGVDADYIASTFLNGNTGTKLLLSPADRATLEAVVSDTTLPEHASEHVVENLQNFEAKMRNDEFDSMALWQGL